MVKLFHEATLRDISIKQLDIYVKDELVSTGYTRVVDGGRGKYLEIHPDSLVKDVLEIEPNQEYRLTDKWKQIVFYAWYRTKKYK